MVAAEFTNACSVFAAEEVCVSVCKGVCLSVCKCVCFMWHVCLCMYIMCMCLKEHMLLPMYGNACYIPLGTSPM